MHSCSHVYVRIITTTTTIKIRVQCIYNKTICFLLCGSLLVNLRLFTIKTKANQTQHIHTGKQTHTHTHTHIHTYMHT